MTKNGSTEGRDAVIVFTNCKECKQNVGERPSQRSLKSAAAASSLPLHVLGTSVRRVRVDDSVDG